MNALFPTPARPLWPNTDGSRTPYRVFTDQEIHDLEQEKIYRGKTWNFLALEAELPKVGDYKSTYVGDTPVVVTRAEDGTFAAWVNRCAHRGAKVCRFNRGNATSHQCVYHQWSYDTKGDLQGVPFRRGFKGQPGMPESFDMKEHGLQKLRVETYDGIVFGTFRHDMESLHDYLGAEMRPWIDRVCGNGKKLVYLGCLRQFANSNWKLYYENVKDPYHASLLHLFHVTFNIARVGMAARSMVDARHGMHSCLTVTKNKESENADSYKANNVSSYNENVRLQDMEVLRMRDEFDEPITNHIQTIFPSLVIQQIHNTLACRQVLPKGPGKFELVFHLFGYEDDDEELRAMRLLQSNLIGPAGFISMEDTEATELVQAAITPDPDHESAMFMGHGAGDANKTSFITEELLRNFWSGYKKMLEL